MIEQINLFITNLTVSENLAPTTIYNYKRDLILLRKLSKNKEVGTISSHDINQYVIRLHSGGAGGRSISRRLSAWRKFFSFLSDGEKNQVNPCLGIKTPRSAKKLPSVLTPDEIEKLLEKPKKNLVASRDLAMFELMYSSGLRLSELVNIKNCDIDEKERLLRVTGKGLKTRIVPIGKKAIIAIQTWKENRIERLDNEYDFLFTNSRGDKLSTRTIQRRLKSLGIKQQITTPLNPHMLRHSFASHLLQSSGDLRAVQELLGHESIRSTQVYSHLDWDHLAHIYDQAHPRARKKSG